MPENQVSNRKISAAIQALIPSFAPLAAPFRVQAKAAPAGAYGKIMNKEKQPARASRCASAVREDTHERCASTA